MENCLVLQEYSYLDDEGQTDDAASTGSLTAEKWQNYGTQEAVEKSRQKQTVRTWHQMAGIKMLSLIYKRLGRLGRLDGLDNVVKRSEMFSAAHSPN